MSPDGQPVPTVPAPGAAIGDVAEILRGATWLELSGTAVPYGIACAELVN